MARRNSFRHLNNTRCSEKTAALIGDHGPLGYGVYWMIIEMLHQETGYRIEYTDKRIRRMSAQVGIGYEPFRKLLDDMISLYELLVLENGFLTSPLFVATAVPEQTNSPVVVAIKPQSENRFVSAILHWSPGAVPDILTGCVVDDEQEAQQTADEPTATGEAEPQQEDAPPEAAATDSSITQPIPGPSFETYRFYQRFIAWVRLHACRVLDLQEQFTIGQVLDIKERYPEELTSRVLKEMHDTCSLTQDHTSAYQAFCSFAGVARDGT